MHRQGVAPFKYYVGVSSLAQIATRDDRVCVLNILGGESSDVTPVSHAYSGGNVVFGTSPGRRGQFLDTPIGSVPVYNSVLEGLNDGHRFNCGVVYLPPAAARDGVAELIRVNPELRKIFIVTEKLSVHDSREIRALGQWNGVDIFGGNSLGVADAWHQVRIGGALGGDDPGASLRKGSIAILSNSGGFTTTIAAYLRMAGWGTTTLISSGKDVYIHYAAPEFAFALANDARSKAAVLYCEPGGYYELEAEFSKPVVACVVGRWKSRLTRAVGHAGAMAGGADDAGEKERWFLEKFGVEGIFTPERPVFSARGALVTNIAHIPAALTAVMRENAARPDFAPEGSMALKPWFGSAQGLKLPRSLDLPVVEALAPYNAQIAQLNRQIGLVMPRQSLKDASGASQMHAQTQVSSLHRVTTLQATEYPLESNICLALLHEPGGRNDQALVNVAVGTHLDLRGQPALAAAQAAREAGNAPNSVLAAAAAIIGPRYAERARALTAALLDAFAAAGLQDALDESFDSTTMACDAPLRELPAKSAGERDLANAMYAGLAARGVKSAFVRYVARAAQPGDTDALLAAIAATLAWGPLMRKRISRATAESLPWWLRLFGVLIGASVDASQHEAGRFCGVPLGEILERHSLTDIACRALFGRAPEAKDRFAMQTLVGLLLTNGPGAITAQGAKGAVSADGPETPARVQLNKAMIGFLTHSGYTHGGNGYEGVAFLLERFQGVELRDPGEREHGIDLNALALAFVREYAKQKAAGKELGSGTQAIPCINHPVFKDRPVNIDPREEYVRKLLEERGEYNVFHEFYRTLVQTLFDEGVTRNVFCVNVDGVIATLLLRALWAPYQRGELTPAQLETAAFTVFLYARMIGCAAEIDDHLNRGRNMDMRTPASQCRFVS